MYKITSDGELLHRRPQEISTKTSIWEWSEVNQCPEVTGERDDQEFVQSFEDCALNAILDRYMPEEAKELFGVQRVKVEWDMDDSSAVDASEYEADLDTLNAMASQAEEMRRRYRLPADMSLGQVLKTVTEKIYHANNREDFGVSRPVHVGDTGHSNVDSNDQRSTVENNAGGEKE